MHSSGLYLTSVSSNIKSAVIRSNCKGIEYELIWNYVTKVRESLSIPFNFIYSIKAAEMGTAWR